MQKTGTKKCLKKLRGTVSESDESNTIQNTKHACIVEAHDSTRKRLESTLPKDHEDHIAGKGYNSISHHILVHKFLPMPQAMKIPDAKAVVHQEWKKFETIPAWQVDEMKSKMDGFLGAQRERKNIHFATYEILFGFRLYWLCMNKKMFETTNNRAIPE